VTDPDGRTIASTYDGNRLVSQTWTNADGTVANVRKRPVMTPCGTW
jgi:YD repeat-containing protein